MLSPKNDTWHNQFYIQSMFQYCNPVEVIFKHHTTIHRPNLNDKLPILLSESHRRFLWHYAMKTFGSHRFKRNKLLFKLFIKLYFVLKYSAMKLLTSRAFFPKCYRPVVLQYFRPNWTTHAAISCKTHPDWRKSSSINSYSHSEITLVSSLKENCTGSGKPHWKKAFAVYDFWLFWKSWPFGYNYFHSEIIKLQYQCVSKELWILSPG